MKIQGAKSDIVANRQQLYRSARFHAAVDAESLLCNSNREEDIYSYENIWDYDFNSNRFESQGRISSF